MQAQQYVIVKLSSRVPSSMSMIDRPCIPFRHLPYFACLPVSDDLLCCNSVGVFSVVLVCCGTVGRLCLCTDATTHIQNLYGMVAATFYFFHTLNTTYIEPAPSLVPGCK